MKYFSENEVISILINTCKELCKDKIYKPETYMTFREKIDERPSIELPDEHGRLGDLDALSETIEYSAFWDDSDHTLARDIVKYAPTIIEASKETD